MPNWCITTYKIVGESREELQDLHTKLTALWDISQQYNDACSKARLNDEPLPEPPPEIVDSDCSLFLGTIVKAFGGDWEKVYCRGWIASIDPLNEECFYFLTETAWGEINEVWDLVMRHYKTLEYYYLAEEPGNLHFVTNDVNEEHFPESFYVYDDVNNQTEYPQCEEELLKYMANVMEVEKIKNREELDKLLEEFNERDADNNLYYYEIARIPYQPNRDDDGDLCE